MANLVEAGRRPISGTAAAKAAPRRLSSLGSRQVDAAARLNATIASVAEEEEDEGGDGDEEMSTGAAGDDSDGEDFETVENKKARRALRLDHAVRQQVQTLWDTADTKLFRMRRDEYLDYHLSACRWLMEEEGEEVCRTTALPPAAALPPAPQPCHQAASECM